MSSKVYEEAIADARKLKEVAEENAKKAILEAVTPRIRDFIEGQLLEEASTESADTPDQLNENAVVDLEDDVVLDESSLRSLVEMLGGTEILASLQEGSEVLDDSIKMAVGRLSDEERQKLFNLADKINETADKLNGSSLNNNENSIQENEEMKNEKFYEVDLRALREQVENELAEMAHGHGDMEEDSMEEMYEEEGPEEGSYMEEDMEEMSDAEVEEELMREIKLMLDLGDEIEEDDLPEDLAGMLVDDEEGEGDEDVSLEDADEEGELEDMPMMADEEGDLPELDAEAPMEDLQETFEIDPNMLRQELARVRRQLREGKGIAKDMEHHFGGKGKANAGVKKSYGGGAEGQDVVTNPPQLNKLNEAIRNLRRKNRAQQEKLNKYRSAVHTLREQLEDLNLFNAKLLYVNKLLQNKTLNESQKKSVIKALDEAKSLDETKTLYRSLTESLSQPSKPLNESARYGSSSRTTTSSSSRNAGEAAGEMSRWQALAGLK
tara:strand:- start:742 stop:2226 length:1485 start_codon:yes stop_codon:yes gene_type:complete